MSAGILALSVAIDDLDEDGDADLAVVNTGVSILLDTAAARAADHQVS